MFVASEPVAVVRATYLHLVLGALQESGKDYTACLQQFNLPSNLVDTPNAYLPLKAVLSFAQFASSSGDFEDLVLRVGNQLRVTSFHPDVRSAVRQASSLDSALETFCELADREQSTARYRRVPGGDAVGICSSFNDRCGSVASYLGEWLQIMALVKVVRYFAGESWTPSEITFQSRCKPGQRFRHAFPETRFLTGQAATGVTVAAELLRLTSSGEQARYRTLGAQRNYDATSGPASWDFSTSLCEILQTYLCDGYPDITLAARITCCSVRTLQRRLKQCGVSFSQVVQQARFKAAARLLCEPDTQVIDATYAVGYSDPSHFARAFRRLAGVSPRQFQEREIWSCY